MENSLGSFDPNVLPMDAFILGGKTSDALRILGLKAPWIFGESTHALTSDLALRANGSIKWTLGTAYEPDDVVYHDEDGLWYMNLVATDSIEPDYSDSGVEGTTWKWVAGSVSGFVSGRGWWTKFADGTLIQRSIDLNPTPITILYILFPIPFYDDNVTCGAGMYMSTTWTGSTYGTRLRLDGTHSYWQFFTVNACTGSLTAIGRWKA